MLRNYSRFLLPYLPPALWAMFWFIPWLKLLPRSMDWVALAIALVLFVVPGFAASNALLGRSVRTPAHVLIGFSFSHLAFAFLGIIARMIHISFDALQLTFFVVSAVVIILSVRREGFYDAFKPQFDPWDAIALVIFAAIISFLVPIYFRFTGPVGADSAVYLAYLTNWQNSAALSFNEVIYGTTYQDSIRFWLACFPMTLALLANLSQVHGLLIIGLYSEPMFTIFAVLAIYEFAIALKLSPRWSARSLLAAVFVYMLMRVPYQPGHAFFERLSEDKAIAAFVFAPAFLILFMLYFRNPGKKELFALALGGFSITLTHPIPLFFVAAIGGMYALIDLIFTREWKKFAISIILFLMILAPVGVLRFLDHPSNRYAYNLEDALGTEEIQSRVRTIGDGFFYGFNPNILKLSFAYPTNIPALDMILVWGLFGAGIATLVWSLFRLRDNELARMIFAASFLVAFSMIPYTGWILGFFISARMLWRTLWMYPAGLAIIVLVIEGIRLLLKWKRIPNWLTEERIGHALSLALMIGVIFIPIDWRASKASLASLKGYQFLLQARAAAGAYFENLPHDVRVLGIDPLDTAVPGLSSKSKAVVFRPDSPHSYSYFLDFDQQAVLVADIQTIMDINTPRAERLRLLEQYDVDYLIMQKNQPILAPLASDPAFTIKNIQGVYIVQFTGE
jgi:hypothetical protein